MSKTFPMFIVDAFTKNTFGGNPAAVCLLDNDSDIPDEIKKKIASEMNLSETVYLSKLDNRINFNTGSTFGIRWFTPKEEVPLCGHATLAAAKIIFAVHSNRNPKITLETKMMGTLFATQKPDGQIVLDFPLQKPHKIWDSRFDPVIRLVVGKLPYVDVQYGYETRKLLIRLDDSLQRSDLEGLQPEFDQMLKAGIPMEGVIVTLKGSPSNGFVNDAGDQVFDFGSRFFAPWVGVNEDPVTGSAHSVLAPYWSEILGRKELNAIQNSARVGEIALTVRDDGRVDIGGEAKVVLKGTIEI